jgi:hypothetical protein
LRSRKEVELIPQVSQQVPLSLFDQLSSGDLLFIDSSHAVKIGSDVLRIYLEIIPRRAPRIFTQMNIHNNTIISQWYCAGRAFGRSTGGYMQNNYACITVPSHYNNAAFMEEHGPKTTTVTIRGNTTAGPCPVGLRSLAVSLGPVTNTSGTLSATANVTTVEYGMQGVVFAIDGHYVSAVMGGGPYKLSYGAAGLPSGAHTVAATVVDAVGLLAESNKQNVLTTSGVGSSGPIGPDVDPSRQDFDIAGNTNDPINGRRATQPVETGRR